MSWAEDNNFDGYDVEEHMEQKSTPLIISVCRISKSYKKQRKHTNS